MSFASARKRAGLTQAAIAKEIGVTESAVSYWDTGTVLPQSKNLVKIARLLGCTVEEILEKEEGEVN